MSIFFNTNYKSEKYVKKQVILKLFLKFLIMLVIVVFKKRNQINISKQRLN